MTRNQSFCRHRTAISSLAAALLLSSPAPLFATESTDPGATCKAKIEGKGFVVSQESTQAFRFNFKFELKHDDEIKGQFWGYDCATRITLASRQPIVITEAGDGSWVVDF